jgi:hypothetical protein
MTSNPCRATGATATINSMCCRCGHNPSDTGADWAQCPSCGKVFCTDCVAERLSAGADMLCPCCGATALSAAD